MEKSFPEQLQPDWVEARTGAERRIGEALFTLGFRPVADAFDESGNRLNGFEAASRVFAAVAYNDANGPDAPAAKLRQGDSLYALNRPDGAETAYGVVVNHYPRAPEVGVARAQLARLKVARPTRRGGASAESLAEAERLLAEAGAPGLSPVAEGRVEEARAVADEEQAKSMLAQAQMYTNKPRPSRKERGAGVFLLQDLLRRYPDTLSAEVARAMLTRWGEPETAPL
jgi:hypothetical protein